MIFGFIVNKELVKSKQVHVPASPGRKAYIRTDPRTKHEKEKVGYKESKPKEDKYSFDKLTKENIQQLQNDKTYQNEFIRHNQGLIKSLANQAHSVLSKMEREDLVQSGNIGLFKALSSKTFNASGKKELLQKKFFQYVMRAVKNSFHDEIGKALRVVEEGSLNIKVDEKGEKERGDLIASPEKKNIQEGIESLKGDILRQFGVDDKKEKGQVSKIFDMLVGMKTQKEMAEVLDIRPNDVRILIDRYIVPFKEKAKEYLTKSDVMSLLWAYIDTFRNKK